MHMSVLMCKSEGCLQAIEARAQLKHMQTSETATVEKRGLIKVLTHLLVCEVGLALKAHYNLNGTQPHSTTVNVKLLGTADS